MKQLHGKSLKKFTSSIPKRQLEIALVLENVRYKRNVAGIFRTADAASVDKLFLTGSTQTPPFGKDMRKASREKERSVNWEYRENILDLLDELKADGYTIIAIEITDESFPLGELKSRLADKQKVAFVAGSEISGIRKFTLEKCDQAVYIPMYGVGKSLNVTVSVGAVLLNI